MALQSPRDGLAPARRRALGIIGGIGPESTIEYYRRAVSALGEQDNAPSVFINSINLKRMLALVVAGNMAALIEYLLDELQKLARAGADLGVLAANTPHVVFDDVRKRSPIPLVSIVEAACDAVRALRLEKVGLIGTRFTMQGRFYSDVFSRAGIALVTPGAEDQAFIHEKYMTELVNGLFVPATRDALLAIVDRMSEREAIQGLILGGTELPLIMTDQTYRGMPLFNTTKIHVQSAVERLLL
jgi:aspartate racemase